ncbi:unnamed protein product [Citrullus colocynthis]|uniref:Uncharacterized protein n=1 Tax=Citrullus colocynthis TaxID=252529 RepID=A0ABP0YB99_9ROSI
MYHRKIVSSGLFVSELFVFINQLKQDKAKFCLYQNSLLVELNLRSTAYFSEENIGDRQIFIVILKIIFKFAKMTSVEQRTRGKHGKGRLPLQLLYPPSKPVRNFIL